MLKRIATADLRTGMFLEELCGSWMDHPFWRAKFTVRTPGELAQIRSSGVVEVWIDTGKGQDVADGLVRAGDRERVLQVAQDWVAEVAAEQPAPVVSADPALELARAARQVHAARERVAAMFATARMGALQDVRAARELAGEVTASVARHPSALISLARLKRADDYTFMHSVAVSALMVALARTLELSEEQQNEAGLAGLLHDVGKVRVPLTILNKPGSLDSAEWAQMNRHPQIGAEIVAQADGMTPAVLDAIRHHHEKFDGSGYPQGLAGTGIPELARMAVVCDVYDAVTSERPYKSGWQPTQAIRKMAEWEGHFDTRIFRAFVKTVGIYPLGSLVRLRSQRLAVVTGHNPQQLLRPTVKAFFSLRSRVHFAPVTIELGSERDEQIMDFEDPKAHGLTHCHELWLPQDPGRHAA
jgi:putative nucleotidyltransferase with HDIG domain